MLIDKIQYYQTEHGRLPKSLAPESSSPQIKYHERPLKCNSIDLSFKGLSFCGNNEKTKQKKNINPTYALLGVLGAFGLAKRVAHGYKKIGTFKTSEITKFFGEHDKSLGKMSEELIGHLKESPLAEKMVRVNKDNTDEFDLYKKTIPQLIWDGLVYPVKILPADILNGTVELLGKIKPLKNWSEQTLKKPLFKNIRQRSKIDAKVNSLQGLIETKEKLTGLDKNIVESELFQRSVKMFDTQKYGAYDTKHERALNRLVSGLPPAIFLATDAYNLSRMMDDDPAKADKEKKTRFKQETARILSSGYLTLITLGALNKYINNSKAGIMLMTGGTVLVTEAFSRLINGKHIKRLSPGEARLENEKNNAPEKDIKPDTSFKANSNSNNQTNNHQKPLLSFDTILKASAAVIGIGYGIKAARYFIKPLDNAFKTVGKQFGDLYKNLTTIPDYKITQEHFDKITKVLEDNDFHTLAEKYKNIAQKNTTTMTVDEDLVKELNLEPDKLGKEINIIHLGQKDKKYVKPIVNFVIAPFKFAYNTITLPFRYTDKLVTLVRKSIFKAEPQASAQAIKPDLSKKDLEVLSKTIESIGEKAMKKDTTSEEFQSYVKDNMLKAFNSTTMSNVSNAELSNLAKTAATAATLWFLMTDNYNMVMLKSNGNDKEGAETKFKERFVQEGSRLFYQTLLIDLFNSTFRSQYNASLMGMSLVTVVDTTLGEILTRKSVGMPIKEHSREELEAIEKEQDEATGFRRGYYDFMRRLTGKRSISSYHIPEQQPQPQPTSFKSNFPPKDKRTAFSSLSLK